MSQVQSLINAEALHRLLEKAIEASERAYAPYSEYKVGAALLAADGRIFTGCNVENAAYPATICAERTAVVKAVSEGVMSFLAILVVTADGGAPCGECRQVLHEFNPSLLVFVARADGTILSEQRLDQLLPTGFGPANLKKDRSDHRSNDA
jgi:cytidine deaminase